MLRRSCNPIEQYVNIYASCSHPSSFTTINNPTKKLPFEKIQLNNNSLQNLNHYLQEFTDSRNFQAGFKIQTHLIKFYPNGYPSLWNKLLNLFCQCGQFTFARHLFDKMPERNIVSYNTMILAYIRKGYGFEAVCVYLEMMKKEENVKPNHITLAGLIGACDGGLMGVFHGQATQYGLSCNEYVGCSLIDGYAKEMKLEDAMRAFDEIGELDLVCWNIMIDACVRNNSKEHAICIFSWMVRERVAFDGFTLTSIVKTCSELEYFKRGMVVHGCAIKFGLACATPISNSLITMYSKCEQVADAVKIFVRIVEPNVISWTTMIAGFMQNGHNEEAIWLYLDMVRLNAKENDFTFASILPACTNLVSLEQGRQIHARIAKSPFGMDVSVNNALIDMYSKCGNLEEAYLLFRTMGKHDRVSCTSMIIGFGQHGKGREALKILDDMANEGLHPDDVTFLGCISACSHGGHVDEGIQIFKRMVDVYNVKPRREHFSCVVDMLGRAGRLKEAESFIKEIGIESDVFVWEAMLGACRVHGEMALGERSARKIIELQPEKDGAFALLANIYGEQQLWQDMGVVRENLVAKKEAGCSWVS